MKTKQNAFMLGLAIAAVLLLLLSPHCNAQKKKMSTKDLTEVSTTILYGKCTKVKSDWNEDKDLIFTTITIVPEEYLKGNLGSEALITVPGGRVDDIIYEVSEMPVFEEGEEVFTFIWKHPSGKNLVTGGEKGKLKIEKDKNSGKRVVIGTEVEVTEQTAKKSASPLPTYKAQTMLLEDFAREVKRYVK
jgi:hypothetical protein